MAASTAFYLTVLCTYPPGATQVGQATTYQIVAPWGQTTPCYSFGDAFNQLLGSGGMDSGWLGNYLNFGTTRGLTTTSATVPTGASYFQTSP